MWPQKHGQQKHEVDQLDFIIIKIFSASKGTIQSENIIQRMKKEFTNPLSEKGLVSRIYKEHLQFNNKKTKSPNNTWAINKNSYFEECKSNHNEITPFYTH